MCDSAETLWQGGCTHLSASRMLDWVARRSQRLAAWEAHRLQSSELTATGHLLPKVRASVKKLLVLMELFPGTFPSASISPLWFIRYFSPTIRIRGVFWGRMIWRVLVPPSPVRKMVPASAFDADQWQNIHTAPGTFSPAASISLWLLRGVLKSLFVFF